MSLSRRLIELMDLEGHKHRAKLKRSLRERESRVVSDLMQWESLSMLKKERLQKKCFVIAQYYFKLARQEDEVKPAFQFAIERLGKWHESIKQDHSGDRLITELSGYIQHLKSTKIFKSDQIKLFKLGVLYHQLALIKVTPWHPPIQNKSLSIIAYLDCMKPSPDPIALSTVVLKDAEGLRDTFSIAFLTMISRSSLKEREGVLNGLFSDSVIRFINILGYCALDPGDIFKNTLSITELVKIKKGSIILYDLYLALLESIKPYRASVNCQADNLINITKQSVLEGTCSHQEKISLLECLLHQTFPIKHEMPIQACIKRFQVCYESGFDMVWWFDLMIALQSLTGWKIELKNDLSKQSLQRLLDTFQLFSHRSFCEILSVIKKRKDRHSTYHTLYEATIAKIALYQAEINQRVSFSAYWSETMIVDSREGVSSHHAFFERLENIYCQHPLLYQDKVTALYHDISADFKT